MKKILVLALALVIILGISACDTAGSGKIEIGIIQYVTHNALDASREGFIAALADNGFVDGENIEIDYQNAQADQNNLSTISDRFVSNKADMVLAIATPAAQSIAGKTTDIPIFATAVTDFVDARLVDSNEKPGGNVSGTSDMNPIAEQIDLLIKLAPETQTIGLLYTSSEDNSVLQAGIAKEYIESIGLGYTEVTVTNANDVQQAALSLVDKCDAIYVPTDNALASAFATVYGVTVQSKTPVVAGESNMVKDGGLATLGINYYNLGYQTGVMAVEVLKGNAKIGNVAIQRSETYDFTINGTVAGEIGIEIPDDLRQYVIEG